jgi:hypothetical protein
VLFAVDNYQALWSPTSYGVPVGLQARRMLDPSELRLARALRIMSRPAPANGVAVAAETMSGMFSPKTKVRGVSNHPRETLRGTLTVRRTGLWSKMKLEQSLAACSGPKCTGQTVMVRDTLRGTFNSRRQWLNSYATLSYPASN